MSRLSTFEGVVRHHEPRNQRKSPIRTRVSQKDPVRCADQPLGIGLRFVAPDANACRLIQFCRSSYPIRLLCTMCSVFRLH